MIGVTRGTLNLSRVPNCYISKHSQQTATTTLYSWLEFPAEITFIVRSDIDGFVETVVSPVRWQLQLPLYNTALGHSAVE